MNESKEGKSRLLFEYDIPNLFTFGDVIGCSQLKCLVLDTLRQIPFRITYQLHQVHPLSRGKIFQCLTRAFGNGEDNTTRTSEICPLTGSMCALCFGGFN